MNMLNNRKSIGGVMAAAALTALAMAGGTAAQAADWGGNQQGWLFSGLHSPSDSPDVSGLISVTGNTVVITAPSNREFDLTTAQYGRNRLLGISQVWIVSKSGGNGVALTTSNSGGKVFKADGSSANWENYTYSNAGSPAGYSEVGGGSGFGGNDSWIEIGPASLAGKTSPGYVRGEFTFGGLSNLNLADYTLGIDYLVQRGQSGQTGRAWFSNWSLNLTGGGGDLTGGGTPPPPPGPGPDPVPEPGAIVTGLTMAGMTGLGLVRGRRRQRAATSAAA